MHDKALNIAKNPKHGYQRGTVLKVYKFFDKKSSGSAVKIKIMSYQKLAEKLNLPIIRKFEKRKVHSSFKENVCGVDLVDESWHKPSKMLCR